MTPEEQKDYNEGLTERKRERARLADLLGLLRRDSTEFDFFMLEGRVLDDKTVTRWRKAQSEDCILRTSALEAVQAMSPEQRRALAVRVR